MGIEFDVVPERVGIAERTKYLDAKIEKLREMISTRPPMPATEYEAHQWTRRFMAHYGKVLGAIEYAVDFRDIPHAMGANIEARVKRMIQFHMGTLIIGKGS